MITYIFLYHEYKLVTLLQISKLFNSLLNVLYMHTHIPFYKALLSAWNKYRNMFVPSTCETVRQECLCFNMYNAVR